MNYKYCPECGHKGSVKEITKTKYSCSNCDQVFWNNPKTATAAVFVKNGELLYAVRKFDPNKGKYEFPGGYMDYGEDPYDSCIREIKEEMGVKVERKDLHLLTAYLSPDYRGDTVDLIFVIKKWYGEPAAKDDVERLEWKPVAFMQKDDFFQPYFDLADRLISII